MSHHRAVVVAVLLLALAPALARAQAEVGLADQRPASGPAVPPTVLLQERADSARARPSTALMIGGGLVGGAIGTLGGAYTGAAIVDETCQGEGCYAGLIYGAFAGAVVAESVLLPLGVHVAAGGRGDLGTSMAASAGLGAAALGMGLAFHADDPVSAIVLATVPVAQLTVSILHHR